MKVRCASLAGLLLAFACAKQPKAEPESKVEAAPATASAVEPGPDAPGAAQGAPDPSGSAAAKDVGQLVEVSGEELLLAMRQLGGKGTLVNAWASWCGPCRREMPMLIEQETPLGKKGISLLLVSVDEPEARPKAIEFLRSHDAALPSFVARRPLGVFKAALNPRWPGMLPATFLFDATGKLRYFWGGPVYEDELAKVIDQFLAGTLVDGEARFGLAPGQILGGADRSPSPQTK
jgi:thiol-disulfide isomerase/thioredoxin